MGIVKSVRGTNIDAKEIREVPIAVGDTSPIAGSLARRDSYGNLTNYWVANETTDIDVRANAQYVIIKQTSKSMHIVTTDANGTSSDLTLLNPVGDYFRLGFTGEKATVEVKVVG